MTFVLEKDVPMPNAGGRPRLYPWRQMQIGESFVVDKPKASAGGLYNAAKLAGIKIAIRSEDASHARIWRVA